jgi:hypothetical protein
MQRQVEHWRQAQITDDRAKLIFYAAFIDGKLDAPRSLLSEVHRLYFEPQYEEFSPRTMWSLSNAFTSAFKKLDPVPQFKATAKLGEFLNPVASIVKLLPVQGGHHPERVRLVRVRKALVIPTRLATSAKPISGPQNRRQLHRLYLRRDVV